MSPTSVEFLPVIQTWFGTENPLTSLDYSIDHRWRHRPWAHTCSRFAETESCANFHVAGTEKIYLISEICLYPVASNLKFNFHTKNSLHADRLYSLKIRHFLGSKLASLRNYIQKLSILLMYIVQYTVINSIRSLRISLCVQK